MIVNQANLSILFTAYKAAFQGGLGQAPSQYGQVATIVPSSTSIEEYAWLGQLPGMREWIGDRVVQGLSTHGYNIKNKLFEMTIGVPRTAIEDDQYGVYGPLFTEMGRSAAANIDQLVFSLLGAGRTALCYDQKPFFSVAHDVINAKGKTVSQGNVDDDGTGPTWYVLDTTRALKPMIWQNRKAPNFVAKDKETDENVFNSAEYKYGIDSRGNTGFGFWQLAYASNKALNKANLEAAIVAMTSRTGDQGRPLGINPNLLVTPPQLEFQAAGLMNNDFIGVAGAGAENNELKGRLMPVVVPWLAVA